MKQAATSSSAHTRLEVEEEREEEEGETERSAAEEEVEDDKIADDMPAPEPAPVSEEMKEAVRLVYRQSILAKADFEALPRIP
eukprot:433676-Amphidinium_carterae.1